MEARHGVVGRVWIADRGMSSAANLAWLCQTGRRYIIGAPKAELRKFAAELATAHGWRAIRDGIEVKLVRWPDTCAPPLERAFKPSERRINLVGRSFHYAACHDDPELVQKQ